MGALFLTARRKIAITRRMKRGETSVNRSPTGVAPMRVPVALALSASLVFGMTGCTRSKDLKGYIADQEMVAAIQPGVDNRASVMKTLGRPTVESEFDKKVWYYVSRPTKQLAFLHPQPVDQQVVVVRFDAKDNVAAVEKLGMDQIVAVNASGDKTPTRGKDISALQQIFGNIGKFAPTGGGPQ
jgi:outer membrane protein assembly factor BamE (lipoprotein component of BamABCDE complex)